MTNPNHAYPSGASGNTFDDLAEIAFDCLTAMDAWVDARRDGDPDELRRVKAKIAFHQARFSVRTINEIERRVLHALTVANEV